jgi:hypothetical protein
MSSLPGFGTAFFETTRNTILSGFLALPILLITVSGFLATATANVGMILLFLGQIFVVPLAQILMSLLRPYAASTFVLDPNLTYATFPRLSAFSPADTTPNMVPPVTSHWVAQMMFFSSYLMMNAISLYTADMQGCPSGWIDMGLTCQEPIVYENCPPGKVTTPLTCETPQYDTYGTPKPSIIDARPHRGGSVQPKTSTNTGDFKSENRKAHAITALIIIILALIAATTTYYRMSNAETPGSIAVSLLVFVPLGIAWFQLALQCGLSSADVFGIASQLNVPTGTSMPYACVNITKS